MILLNYNIRRVNFIDLDEILSSMLHHEQFDNMSEFSNSVPLPGAWPGAVKQTASLDSLEHLTLLYHQLSLVVSFSRTNVSST